MPEPLSLWGEVWFFWAGGGDEAWEGDLSYRPTSYEVISEPRRRPMGWKVE